MDDGVSSTNDGERSRDEGDLSTGQHDLSTGHHDLPTGHHDLSAAFEGHRAHLLAAARRVLGSSAEAEDAVQETWLRLDRHRGERIDNLGGWLTRVVGRICIDMLRSRSSRAESALDSWTDELVVTRGADDPEAAAMHADALAPAMLIVLETLGPRERLAFVLHDMFAVPFAQIAPIVGGSPEASKMLASRARRKVQQVPRPTGTLRQRREVVDAFLTAAHDGDFAALLRLLDPEVTWHQRTPRGILVKIGADEVLAAVRRGDPNRIQAHRVTIDGEPGILVRSRSGRPLGLMCCTVSGGVLVDIVSIAPAPALADVDADDAD